MKNLQRVRLEYANATDLGQVFETVVIMFTYKELFMGLFCKNLLLSPFEKLMIQQYFQNAFN